MGERVRITDVSPRDGLQNEPGFVPTQQKAELVELLCKTGVDEVEVTSFVSPKWVPQLGDANELLSILASKRRVEHALPSPSQKEGGGQNSADVSPRRPLLSSLVPNERGLAAALAASAAVGRAILDRVSVFTAASETFSRNNTNASIAETIERFRPMVPIARDAGLDLRGYVSCAIACPYEGPVAPARVGETARSLCDLGIAEIDLGDTIGAGTTDTVRAMLGEVLGVLAGHPVRPWLTLHLHDTFGHAADCVRAALDLGIRSFDGSVAGLGGCPYASRPGKPAPGNIDTQLLVRTIHAAGYETGVNLDALARAAEFARKIVGDSRAAAVPKGGAG
jgi:hydroxymethylglutaryl-CoA lyase